MVKIITDSTSDLGKELYEKYDIEMLPLYVNFKDKSYKDQLEMTTEGLYQEVDKVGELPKTAAVTIGDFVNSFKVWLDKGYEIIFTGISAQMSSTLNNAVVASRELEAEDRVFCVDSKNLSTGISLLLLKACHDRDLGLPAKKIAENMEIYREKIKTQFAIETMEYLYKGGRCSGIARILGTVLKIKPIIAVRDGKMIVAEKPIGKMKVALDRMIKQILADKDNLDGGVVFITHSIAYESEKYIRNILEKELNNVEIITTLAGCTISSHCGPGCIGILYITK